MKKNEEIKMWVEDALRKGYTNEEIIEILEKNKYTRKEIENILAVFNSLKTNWQGLNEEDRTEKELQSRIGNFEEELSKIEKNNESVEHIPEPKLTEPTLKSEPLVTSPKLEEKKEENIEKKVEEEKKWKFFKKEKQKDKLVEEIKEISKVIIRVKQEVAKAVVGQEEVIDSFICALLCGGHVLLEGVPGIAKTLIVKSLAEASGCSSNRVQFTVDLLPSDIIGITTYTPEKGFETIKGPIFANFIVADEINRSPPKTQSALIEAMQEKQVTIAKETYKLPPPFFVMANNNPLESSGVYDLPEAQIDRFLFKLLIGYPDKEDEKLIMSQNMTIRKFESFNINPVLNPEKILRMQEITKKIYVDDKIKDYIVRIIQKTRTRDFEHGKYIEWGGSPRASIALYIASKAWALMNGRNYVIPKDVKSIAHYVLRHRIILNYKATAEKITSDKVIDEILEMVKV